MIKIIIAFSLLLNGCSNSRRGERIVARVDSEVLTVSELISQVPRETRDRLTKKQWMQVVEDWVDEQLLVKCAVDNGAEKNPDVKRKISQAKKQILIDYIRNNFIAERIKISDDELKRYYLNHKDDFIREQDEVRALHIVVQSKSAADSIKKFLRQDSSFCALAKRYSSEYSKSDSCDLGWFSRSEILPGLIKSVFSASAGDTIGPIKLNGQYHFFVIIDKQPVGTIRSFEQVKNDIYNTLLAVKFNDVLTNIIDSLRASSQVTIDTTMLEGIFQLE